MAIPLNTSERKHLSSLVIKLMNIAETAMSTLARVLSISRRAHYTSTFH